jgi:acrylyl-CoA reductase (NADPH)
VIFAAPVEASQIAGPAEAVDSTVIAINGQRIMLFGIDSVMRPKADRQEAWKRLEGDLDREKLAEITRVIGLGEVIDAARDIIAGRIRGRIAVKIG